MGELRNGALLNVSDESRSHRGKKGALLITRDFVRSDPVRFHSLPLDVILIIISELLPKVREFQAARSKPNTTGAIMDYLRGVSIEHLLPPPRPSVPRKFVVSS